MGKKLLKILIWSISISVGLEIPNEVFTIVFGRNKSFTSLYLFVNADKRSRQVPIETSGRDDIRILSIATRPDCLDPKIISLLARLNQIKPVWVELGLQTVNPDTAHFIRRGYELNVYDTAIKMLKEAGIYTIVHMIAGLPKESLKDYLNTAKYIASSGADGIKIALLHVLKGTDLAACYYNNEFQIMSMDEYISTLAEIIQILPEDMAIHRITGDGPKNLLIAPLWSSNKKLVYNSIIKYFRENDIHQGRLYR